MATPGFQQQSIYLNVLEDAPTSFTIPVNSADGTPVDVSTGFTAQMYNHGPISDVNDDFPVESINAAGDWSFGVGEVTLSFSMAQAQALKLLLPTLNTAIRIVLSNDSGTTISRLGDGTLTLGK